MSLGHLDGAALSAVLLRHERSSLSLGEYMVGQGIISPAVLRRSARPAADAAVLDVLPAGT